MPTSYKKFLIILSITILCVSSFVLSAFAEETPSDTTPVAQTPTETTAPEQMPVETPPTTDTTTIIPDETPTVSSTPMETVLIRNGDTVIFSDSVPLPATGTVDITDHSGEVHTINANSVLGFLYALDVADNSFAISDLEYYASYNAFYMKCLTPQDGVEACDNWQYVIDNTTPWTGMSDTLLIGGESIGLYFGSPHQVIFGTTSITAGDQLAATAQKYNYIDNTWENLSGITIGATAPNPDDPWNPTLIAEAPVDANGAATLMLDTGTYTVGIKEDYYFPSYTVTVTAKDTSGTIGGTSITPMPSFDTAKAIAFLATMQQEDGSYGSPMYSDWVAIAFAAEPSLAPNMTKLKAYLGSISDVGSLTTDAERHAMALEALGIDPYAESNFIRKITNAYDGTQIGDPTLVNDDIFAIFPLMHAGYTTNDTIIQSTVTYIISKQSSDGGFGSVDMTAAAIQALEETAALPDVSEAITKARQYIASHEQSGGWQNSFSTSWALQGIAALGESPDMWKQNTTTPLMYLTALQQPDGGVEGTNSDTNMRVWATAYAIPAAQGKTWSSLLHSFPKPEVERTTTNDGNIQPTEQKKTEAIEAPAVEKEIEKPIVTDIPELLTETDLIYATLIIKDPKPTKRPSPYLKQIPRITATLSAQKVLLLLLLSL